MRGKTLSVMAALAVLTLSPTYPSANPLPPVSMPREEMQITIGTERHVTFFGTFFYDSFPWWVGFLDFPLPPVNASNIRVFQDGSEQPWEPSPLIYSTVLPEYPELSMFRWYGPFPAGGTVFIVEYEHQLFERGEDLVFFYSLGTGKYFTTYDEITDAIFTIDLPHRSVLKSIELDDTPVDPSNYTLSGTRLELTLTSQFGPFTSDLILTIQVREPPTAALLGIGLLGLFGAWFRGREANGSTDLTFGSQASDRSFH